jgi:hypothetical protein
LIAEISDSVSVGRWPKSWPTSSIS